MAEESFKLPGSSFEELVRIVEGYSQLKGEVGPAEVAQLLGVNRTQVSRNNAFLKSVGLIEGGQKKAITELGSRLARAIQYDQEVQARWREVVESSDFMKKILAAVKIRGGMEPSVLRAHIAYSAGQPRSPQVMAGAGAVVRLLEEAGLLREDGGQLVTTDDSETSRRHILRGKELKEGAEGEPPAKRTGRARGVTVQLTININASANEVRELSQQVGDLLRAVREPQEELEAEDSGE